ncbi:MAG: patatin-like phospholipase family protein [Xanthomonadales bacterium]|nr:patatin-like phospholipase family protein [Gammaproteobacteria bacterium]MBT8053699.1 patatin-like phospholipase family protein [Gammaproteobacteria bacterium]NND57046.1 patatin-like phospholipase family protein [Xanthomonadales bacterium]NNK51872.1 patatin-like phospholipase family protein [Xanthomonadales bacterium]
MPDSFDKIGLALSGGGVRAVGFHLGTLDILERVDLLKKVTMLSAVSGGSLVALGYALSLKTQQPNQKTFKEFFKDFFETLPPLNTLEELISGAATPNSSGYHTLVDAMARVYKDKYFEHCYGVNFGNPKFDVFWNAAPQMHLKDLFIHSTDFKTGLNFRFQFNDPTQGRVGDDQVYLTESQAKEFYLSDIMTTSACLPGLLEPMFMPADYQLTDAMKLDIRDHFKNNCWVEFDYVALMDGGMLDNQGISSIVLNVLQKAQPAAAPSPAPPKPQPVPPLSAFDYARWWRDRNRELARSATRLTTQYDPTSVSSKRPDGGDAGPNPPPIKDTQEDDCPDNFAALNGVLQDLDLFIISDTPTFKPLMARFFPKNNIFESITGAAKWFLDRKLNHYFIAWVVFLLLCLVGLVLGAWGLVTVWAIASIPLLAKIGISIALFVALATLFLHFVGGLIIWKGAQLAEDKLNDAIPLRNHGLWYYLKNLTLGDVVHMLRLRAMSVLRLTSEIFLNRVRQLSYRWALEVEELDKRIVPNELLKLRTLTLPAGLGGSWTPRGPYTTLPAWMTTLSPDMKDIIEEASEMSTQIHLDGATVADAENNLKLLAASGQITTCFNLLEYLWQFHSDGSAWSNAPGYDPFPGKPNAGSIFLDIKEIWDKLQLDPYQFVEDRLS